MWKNYCLSHNNLRMLQPELKLMKDYGVGSGSEITFAKYRNLI